MPTVSEHKRYLVLQHTHTHTRARAHTHTHTHTRTTEFTMYVFCCAISFTLCAKGGHLVLCCGRFAHSVSENVPLLMITV